ncbi:MAG: hypothetical protein IT536_10860 [Hyphomicrobiales bacterium]|nr:hypothetical protein [Hyphomicrobiales bacterium]
MRAIESAPGGCDLLYQRMEVLGLTHRDILARGESAWQDMQRTCCACGDKEQCGRDMETRPDEDVWRGYCANGEVLRHLAQKKKSF